MTFGQYSQPLYYNLVYWPVLFIFYSSPWKLHWVSLTLWLVRTRFQQETQPTMAGSSHLRQRLQHCSQPRQAKNPPFPALFCLVSRAAAYPTTGVVQPGDICSATITLEPRRLMWRSAGTSTAKAHHKQPPMGAGTHHRPPTHRSALRWCSDAVGARWTLQLRLDSHWINDDPWCLVLDGELKVWFVGFLPITG